MTILDDIRSKINGKEIYRILFLGDSITSAEFVHPSFREIVEDRLKEKLESESDDWQLPYKYLRFFNSSFQGATSADFVNKLQEEVFNYYPDIVITMLGKNDYWLKIDKETSVKNIENILIRIQREGIKTAFLTSSCSLKPEVNKEFEKYVNLYNDRIKESVDIYIDLFSYFKKLDLEKIFTWKAYDDNSDIGLKKGEIDFIHPNSFGHIDIAELILKDVFDIKFDRGEYLKELINRTGYNI